MKYTLLFLFFWTIVFAKAQTLDGMYGFSTLYVAHETHTYTFDARNQRFEFVETYTGDAPGGGTAYRLGHGHFEVNDDELSLFYEYLNSEVCFKVIKNEVAFHAKNKTIQCIFSPTISAIDYKFDPALHYTIRITDGKNRKLYQQTLAFTQRADIRLKKQHLPFKVSITTSENHKTRYVIADAKLSHIEFKIYYYTCILKGYLGKKHSFTSISKSEKFNIKFDAKDILLNGKKYFAMRPGDKPPLKFD